MVPRSNLRLVRDNFHDYLNSPPWYDHGKINFAPDVAFYGIAKDNGMKIYATNPLVVWHKEGNSNTWSQQKQSALMGRHPDDSRGNATEPPRTPTFVRRKRRNGKA